MFQHKLLQVLHALCLTIAGTFCCSSAVADVNAAPQDPYLCNEEGPPASPSAARTGERTPLWSGPAPVGDGTTDKANAFITVHHPAKPNGTAVVICPGGGYGMLVKGPEGHKIARWLNESGIVGIFLEYRLPKGRPYVPLLDAQRAIRTVRHKAQQWKCDPKAIGIMGFSAGGHLAACCATRFDAGDPKSKDPVEKMSCQPDFAVLIYPVITMGPKTHGGSKRNLLGRSPDAKTVDLFSTEKQVTEKTPPTFLAHAQNDSLVSPDNSQIFFEALQSHKVKAKYLKLPSGNHGLSGYRGPMWDAWQTQSLQWLAEIE